MRQTPASAARELLARNEARGDLLKFTQYMMPNFQIGKHHREIADALMAIERRDIDRLLVQAPPRHTKSELVSRKFPAWYLGRNPNKQIICATYAADLARDFGRHVRNLVRERDYANIFDVGLRQDSQAADRWHTTNGGVYVAAGVGGAITGRGMDIGNIDDPFKNREEADSPRMREKVWNWYTSTFYTRLMPRGTITVTMTRWSEDDLAGRLLEHENKGGDRWHVVRLAAIADEGTLHEKALWPEWFPLDALTRIRGTIGPRDWHALYQQNPHPEEGTFFQRAWFKRFEPNQEPRDLNIYITSDFALSDGEGDFTEIAVWGIDPSDNIYALDWWCGQTPADAWIEVLCDKIIAHKPMCFFGESGVIRRALESAIAKRMRERRAYCRTEWITSVGNKPLRARAFQARASMGRVHIPTTVWGERLIAQLCTFPAGHDDAVDACSMLGQVIADAHPAITKTPEPERREPDYGQRGRKAPSWRTA